MSSLALVAYYMVKEAFSPRLHHSKFKEYIDDVDIDCSRRTHSFEHMKYIKRLQKLAEEY